MSTKYTHMCKQEEIPSLLLQKIESYKSTIVVPWLLIIVATCFWYRLDEPRFANVKNTIWFKKESFCFVILNGFIGYVFVKLVHGKIARKKMKIFLYNIMYSVDPFHKIFLCMRVWLCMCLFEIPTAVSLTSSCSVHVTTQQI